MTTISRISPIYETAGSVAKTDLAGAQVCTPNCPPDCPDCGQVNFKGDEFYSSVEKTRKKKRNIALLSTAGVLVVGAASMIGLGKLHNSPKIANLNDGWIKSVLEWSSQKSYNGCNFVKTQATSLWGKVKNIGKSGS